jgi:enamine deaminase RidA (YjgF/YER057c/UK114 family)
VAFQVVQTENVRPVAGRPYSPALRQGPWLVLSGMVSIDKDSNVIGPGDPERQWRTCYDNIKELVEAGGGTLQDVIMLRSYMTDMRFLSYGMQIRQEYWNPPYPSSTSICVAALPDPGFLVEVEAVAYLGD